MATMFMWIVGICAPACGEPAPPPRPPRPPAPVESDRPDDGVMVDGMGALSAEDVRGTFQRIQRSLMSCYATGLRRVPNAAGSAQFFFRVSPEGRVLWAYLTRSDLGQQEVQDCMVDLVRRTQFPRPRGGEAEAMFDIELEPPEAVRYLEWTEADVAAAFEAAMPSVDACLQGSTGFTVTIYVAPGGTVLDAGAVGPDAGAQDRAVCLAAAAMQWILPDPGPQGAKLSLAF